MTALAFIAGAIVGMALVMQATHVAERPRKEHADD